MWAEEPDTPEEILMRKEALAISREVMGTRKRAAAREETR